jgi:protein phosphatase 1B
MTPRSQEVETTRIENAGGCVSMRRVNGDLAVSRALGDFSYKARDDLKDVEQQVTLGTHL